MLSLLQAQRDLALKLSETDDLQYALALGLNTALQVAGLECGGWYVRDQECGTLTLRYNQGFSDRFVAAMSTYPEDSHIARIAAAGKAVYTTYAALQTQGSTSELAENLKFGANLPVLHKGQVIACLHVASRDRGDVNEIQRAALETVAAQMGGVISRLRACEALCQSETLRHFVVSHCADVVVQLSEQHEFAFVSDSCRSVFGYEPREMVGMSLFTYAHPDDRPGLQEGLSGQAGGPSRLYYRHRKKDGDYARIEASVGDLNARQRVMILGDHSGERRLWEKAQISQENLRALLDAGLDAIAITDERGAVLEHNDTFAERVPARLRDRICGRRVEELFPDYPAQRLRVIQKAMETGEAVRFRDTRGDLHLENSVYPVRSQFGPKRRLIMSRNITREKQLLDELQNHRHHLDLLVAERTTKLQQAQQTMKETIRENERVMEKLRVLENAVGHAINGMALADSRGRLTYVNQSFLAMWGLTEEEAIGRDIRSFWVDSTAAQQVFDHLLRRRAWVGELVARRTDSTTFDTQLSASLVVGTDGTPDCMFASFVDVTERKRMEDSLRRSEARLRQAVEAGNVGLWDCDLATNRVYYSPEWKRQIGYEDHEISDDFNEWQDRVHPDDIRTALETIGSFMDNPRPGYKIEFRFRHRNGSYLWIMAQGAFLYDGQGKAVRMLGSHVDITDRKRIEEALRLSQARYAGLFEAMKEGVAVYEAVADGDDFRFIDMNPAGRRIHPADVDDIVGRSVQEVFPGVRDLGLLDVFRDVWKTGEPRYHPVALYQDRRLESWVDNYVLKLPSGEIVAVYQDLTEKKRVENSLRVSEQRFRQLFAGAPISIWDEDFTAVGEWLEGLRRRGVGDLETFLQQKPEALEHALSLVRLVDVNDTTLRLFEVDSKEELLRIWSKFFTEDTLEVFREEVRAIWEGTGRIHCECSARTKGGRRIHYQMHWVAPLEDGRLNLSHVIVALADITEQKKSQEALRESETRYALAQRAAGVGTWEWDIDANTVYWSEDLESLFGLPKGQFDGTFETVESCLHPGDLAAWHESIRRCLEEGIEHDVEFRVVWPDGSVHWMQTIGNMSVNAQKGSRRMMGIVADVTERKLAELSLAASERLLKQTEGLAHVGSFFRDLRTTKGSWSDEAYRIFGYEPGEVDVTTEFFWAHIHPDDRDHLQKPVKDILSGKRTSDLEYRIRRKDGIVRTLMTQSRFECDESGMAIAVYGSFWDVTNQRRHERALRDTLLKLQSVFDSSPDGIIVSDLGGNIVDCNEALLNMHGYSTKEQLMGASICCLVVPDQVDRLKADLARCLNGGSVRHLEYEFQREDGTGFLVELSSGLIRDGSGAAQGLVSITEDVTLRREFERREQEHREEVMHLSQLNTIGQMASEISHELNQPLFAIATSGSGLIRLNESGRLEDQELTSVLRLIVQQAERGGDIIRRITKLARKRSVNISTVSLEAVIGEVFALVAHRARLESVALHFESAAKIPPVFGDSVQLELVILNLVRNSLDALQEVSGKREKRITIRTKHAARQMVEISVSDTGNGIELKDVDEIFAPFRTTKANGLGVGLSLSRSIIEAHGGKLWVDPDPTAGTTFRLTLPIKGNVA